MRTKRYLQTVAANNDNYRTYIEQLNSVKGANQTTVAHRVV